MIAMIAVMMPENNLPRRGPGRAAAAAGPDARDRTQFLPCRVFGGGI